LAGHFENLQSEALVCLETVDSAGEIYPVGHDGQEFPSRYLFSTHLHPNDPSGEVAPVGHDWQEFPLLYWLAGHLQLYTPLDE